MSSAGTKLRPLKLSPRCAGQQRRRRGVGVDLVDRVERQPDHPAGLVNREVGHLVGGARPLERPDLGDLEGVGVDAVERAGRVGVDRGGAAGPRIGDRARVGPAAAAVDPGLAVAAGAAVPAAAGRGAAARDDQGGHQAEGSACVHRGPPGAPAGGTEHPPSVARARAAPSMAFLTRRLRSRRSRPAGGGCATTPAGPGRVTALGVGGAAGGGPAGPRSTTAGPRPRSRPRCRSRSVERAGQRPAVGVAVDRVLGQAAGDHRLERGRHRPRRGAATAAPPATRCGRAQPGVALDVERRHPGQHEVQGRAQGVDVAGRGHVGRRRTARAP